MRLIIFFSFLNMGLLFAGNVHSQYVSLDIKRGTIPEALEELEKQTEYTFVYSSNVLDSKKLISLTVDRERLENVLERIFRDSGISYTIVNRKIVLSRKTERLQQDDRTRLKIVGAVLDSQGEPLPGVNVQETGTNNISVTNMDGEYSIYNVANASSVLKFTYIGFKPQEIRVNDQTVINVRMEEDTQGLEEVVVVGYGSQKRESVIGAITTIQPALLKISQSRTVTNNLAGQMAGIIAVQRSGEPGYDGSDFWIRGISTFGANSKPLVLIDGIERDLNDISPDEIESFSILKDATATAVYGVRGANGVILIQTPQGQIGTPRVSVRGEYGISEPTQLPSFVDGAKYMEVINAARTLAGMELSYLPDAIEKTRNRADPDFFPNVNWLDAVTNDYARNQRVSVSVNGGTELLRYSLIVSYFGEQGILSVDPETAYNSKLGLSRYNVRNNVNINLTQSTVLNVSIGGYIQDRNAPGRGTDDILNWSFSANPILHPVKYSNGQLASRPNGLNPWVMATQMGFVKNYRNKLESTVGLTQDIGKLWKVLDGMNAKALFSFDSYNYSEIARTKTPSHYQAYGRDDEGNLLTSILNEGQEFLGYNNSNKGGNRSVYFETQLNYSRRFGDHTVGALFLYNMRDYVTFEAKNSINSLPYRNQGIAGRVSYAFRDLYFAEANFGYNGSENFMKGHRFGFFPSIAAGWMMTNEPFMSDYVKTLSKLKFRVSWGMVGNDKIVNSDNEVERRFAYIPTISSAGGYSWGYLGEQSRNGLQEEHFGIPGLTWETAEKLNAGIELGLFNSINLQVDLFKEYRSNIFMRRKTIPEIAGYNNMPYANFGKVENQGIDMSLEVNHRFNRELLLSVRGNFTYARNTVTEYDEPENLKNSTRAQTGRSMNQNFGLIALGLYADDDFMADGQLNPELPVPSFGVVKPGDIRYKDLNDDGRIDALDNCPIGNPSVPEAVYGFGLNTQYRNVDFGIFFQGSGNVSTVLGGSTFLPGSGGGGIGNIYANVDDRWTPENPRQDVFWPRLSIFDLDHNKQSSTWWLRDASYMRLKNLEVGYTFPRAVKNSLAARNMRIFLRGTNLLTWASFDMWDPEIDTTTGLKYPTMRVYSIGAEIMF
ncbi:MAG: TonB-dependent receptor [Tannerella sp.]|jgi:TonB-linked SusC/RagA family outer membrane protein|nr:TonB-dependent receptor [Tannerella sp.]